MNAGVESARCMRSSRAARLRVLSIQVGIHPVPLDWTSSVRPSQLRMGRVSMRLCLPSGMRPSAFSVVWNVLVMQADN
jgi:hypothetical protein